MKFPSDLNCDGKIVSEMGPRLTIVYSTVYLVADQRKHQSSASLAFVRGIHRWPGNSPHKAPVTQKIFPFDDVIMGTSDFTHILQNFSMAFIRAPRPSKDLEVCYSEMIIWTQKNTDDITTTKQITTNMCACFIEYTAHHVSPVSTGRQQL